MQHVSVTTQPRRSVIWDEANARYIWLAAEARAINGHLRARKLAAIYGETPAGCYTSPLGEMYDCRDYDCRSRENKKRSERRFAQLAASGVSAK